MNAIRSTRFLGAVLVLSMSAAAQAPAQEKSAAAPKPSLRTQAERIRRALANDPVVSPYAIRVEPVDGKLVLKGRVATKQIHDVAVRIAIDSGFAIGDDLVIATSESYRSIEQQQAGPRNAAAAAAVGRPQAPTSAFRPGAGPLIAPQATNPAVMGMNQVAYPPPLFGRYDDPFYGMEPPPISYAPWFGPMSAYRLREPGAGAGNAPVWASMHLMGPMVRKPTHQETWDLGRLNSRANRTWTPAKALQRTNLQAIQSNC